MTTYFDYLPVELLHLIFQFMPNCDVIWSFYNISSYLNAVIDNYSWSTLNFQSILKSRFDFICLHLNIQRILSLTLSDDLKTPGQVQLFFNRFNLRDLLNLHSLTLLSITNEDIYSILSDLPKLKYLHSLWTDCRSSQPLLLGQILNQLKSLHTLSISHGDLFDHSIALPLHNLKILNAGTCNFLELRRLQMIVPSLISLKIILQAKHQLQLSDFNISWSLEKLDLTLKGDETITFKEIEEFLSHFCDLTHLTLNIRGRIDQLADGNHWETCPTIIRLEKFDFLIEFENLLIDLNRVVNSFSTPFWRELKKWYISITTHNIYTISYFNDQLFLPSTSTPLSTSPNSRWFYSKTKRIKIDQISSSINLNRFHNLERLELSEEKILRSIHNINQFIYLRHLIVHQTISNRILGNILQTNPRIDHLTLSQNDFNQLVPLENIHYLHLQDSIKIINRTQIKQLCRVFPAIKRLFINLNSIRFIPQIIENLRQLENSVFTFDQPIKPISQDWLKDYTHSFTCRSESNRFSLWINMSTVHFKDKTTEHFNYNSEQRSEKCLLQ